jgi:hypothetical protein
MNPKLYLLRPALLTLAFAGTPAMAALTPMSGLYAGISAGQADFGRDRGTFDDATIFAIEDAGFNFGGGISELDNEDYGFGAFLGYRIFDYFAIEGSYHDLGQLEYNADFNFDDGVTDMLGSANVTASSKGPLISLIGILPFDGPWEVFARAGMYFNDMEFAATVNLDGLVGTGSDSVSTEEMVGGLGASFHIGDHISLRGEFTRFFDVGNEDTGEDDVNLIALHAVWRF